MNNYETNNNYKIVMEEFHNRLYYKFVVNDLIKHKNYKQYTINNSDIYELLDIIIVHINKKKLVNDILLLQI